METQPGGEGQSREQEEPGDSSALRGDTGRSQKDPLPLPFISAQDIYIKGLFFLPGFLFPASPARLKPPCLHGNGPREQMGLAGKSPLEEKAQGHPPWGQRCHPPLILLPWGHLGVALQAERTGVFPSQSPTCLWGQSTFSQHLEHLPARLQQTSPLTQGTAHRDNSHPRNSHPRRVHPTSLG